MYKGSLAEGTRLEDTKFTRAEGEEEPEELKRERERREDLPPERPERRAEYLAPNMDDPKQRVEQWNKMNNDPLLAMKQREIQARENIASNPVRREQIRREVDERKRRKKEKAREKKERKRAKKERKKEKYREKIREEVREEERRKGGRKRGVCGGGGAGREMTYVYNVKDAGTYTVEPATIQYFASDTREVTKGESNVVKNVKVLTPMQNNARKALRVTGFFSLGALNTVEDWLKFSKWIAGTIALFLLNWFALKIKYGLQSLRRMAAVRGLEGDAKLE